MRVGIITLYHNNYNYGAFLQAFALQKAIETEGHVVEVIDYERSLKKSPQSTSVWARIKNRITNLNCYGDWINLLSLFSKDKFLSAISNEMKERKEAFGKFAADYIKVSEYYNCNTIANANEIFDAFVCGSDQIWKPTSFDKNYYLAFASSDKRKVSYAASIGASKLCQEDKQLMIPAINALDYVSVREMEAKKLIEGDISKKVEHVVDPTLLWDKEFWEKVAVVPEAVNGKKYIFSYLIGENNKNREWAQKFAKKVGLPLVVIPGVSIAQKYDFCYGNYNMTGVGPAEFLGLIKNAEYVLTDSFHACVFSIQFRTNFYALERFNKSAAESMNGRIYDLLDMFSLENRLISNSSGPEVKEIEKVDSSRYLEQKKKSWEYLHDSLS